MSSIPTNYWAVIVSAIAALVIGWIWYGPLLGKQWRHLSGHNPSNKHMAPTIIINIIGSLLMAYVLHHALVFASEFLNATGVSAGLMAGFWNWLGFIAPVTVGVVLWEGKSWKLWFINAGYYLVTLLVMGAILATWM